MKTQKAKMVILITLATTSLFLSGCSQDNSIETVNKSTIYKISTPVSCDWKFQYVDNFNNANINNDYGLNDNLSTRQLYGDWKNTTWIRKSGAWYDKTTQPWCVQVNHPFNPHSLTFHLEYSAVMLNKLINAGPTGRYRVSFKTNPSTTEQSSTYWTSFMLDPTTANRGYVTQTTFGFLIGSNGGVQVFQNGNAKSVTGFVAPATVYQVVLDIKPGLLVAVINGVQVTAVLNETLPTSAYAYVGAYIDPANPVVSSFDDLVINTPFSTATKHLQNYGYYFASSSSYGDHFNEIADYTNFNFIESLTASTPNTKTNVLQVRWQFWADQSGQLRSDWQQQWSLMLASINQNINKIKAIYVIDEPFWALPCSVNDLNTVLNRIKTDLPTLPIVSVMAYTTVNDTNENNVPTGITETNIANINSNLDMIGADKYVSVAEFSQITSMYTRLVNKRPISTNLFVVPNTRTDLGTTTDAACAEINWLYYDMALNKPNISTIFNFGLWCFTAPSQLPITLEAQRLMGKAIIEY